MHAPPEFASVRHWVFDLDNTLYPPRMCLFDQIEERMTSWVMKELGVEHAEANRLRDTYWRDYGTTLAGLMEVHNVAPDAYLDWVHDVSFDKLDPDPGLAQAISELPGRKIVYTNGSAPYARNVIRARGLDGLFDDVFGVEHADFHPKPRRAAFETVFAKAGLDLSAAAMFEDDPRNLVEPHNMGLRTIHVAPKPDPADHIHHHTDDLAAFLDGFGQ